ncbi:MAG: sensor hybrid histidine kinase [Paenibacillus sp.]|nr:sensor hybrid histidine kinase [Paenibacillus sp.]
MKIKTKLYLGFSLLLLMLVGFFALLQYLSHEHNLMLNEIVADRYNKADLAKDIRTEALKTLIDVRTLALVDTPDKMKQKVDEIRAAHSNINQMLDELDRSSSRSEARSLISSLKIKRDGYSRLQDQEIEWAQNGQTQELIEELNTEVLLRDEFFSLIDDLIRLHEQGVNEQITIAEHQYQSIRNISIALLILGILLGLGISYSIVRNIDSSLSRVTRGMKEIVEGEQDLSTRIETVSKDEIAEVAATFNAMVQALEEKTLREREISAEHQELAWLKSNVAEVTTMLQGFQDLRQLAQTLISKVTPLVGASHGTLYLKQGEGEQQRFALFGSYAYKERKHISGFFRLGEGLAGQCALENQQILLTHVPEDYIKINSSLGEAAPLNIIALPVSFEGKVLAVMELASFRPFTLVEQSLLGDLAGSLGIILENIYGNIKLNELLQESQTMTEELQVQSEELLTQQEELRKINEELERQTHELKASEEMLQSQHEKLERTNLDMQQKADLLEIQNRNVERTNREIERARYELEEKAQQLELSSKYKSQFLANMSHELRTPLNSLLILSKLLSDNKEDNLTAKQVEFANTIYSSGCDLLNLINDILDLSKIESGKQDVHPKPLAFVDVKEFVERQFRPVALDKRLKFSVELASELPDAIVTDEQRLQQILRNLLGNAFKFTQRGSVSLTVKTASGKPEQSVAFVVKDTGIGISQDKQQIVFEAFQQADGTTSRKYGGTGLGLTLSREMAHLLGGDIELQSIEGQGSEFTLSLPLTYRAAETDMSPLAPVEKSIPIATPFGASREPAIGEVAAAVETVQKALVKKILIVEDDERQQLGIKEFISDLDVVVTVAASGQQALKRVAADRYDVIVLDLGLADMPGFELLEAMQATNRLQGMAILVYTGKELNSKEELLLKRFAQTIIIKDVKSHERLKDEIRFLLSRPEDKKLEAPNNAQSSKSADHAFKGKKIMLVDDDARNVYALSSSLESYGMDIVFAENGKEAIEMLDGNLKVDLVLMDIMMPEMDGFEAITHIRAKSAFKKLPIIALTAKAMKEDREKCISVGASDYISKPVDVDQLLSLLRVWLYE